jgi:hypothetical protein
LIVFGGAYKSNSDGTFSAAAGFMPPTGIDFDDDGPNGGDYRNDDNFFLIRRPTKYLLPSYYGTFQLYQACSSAPTFINSPQQPTGVGGLGFVPGVGAFSQGPIGYICNYTYETNTSNVYSVSSSGCTMIAQMPSSTGYPMCWSGDDFMAVCPPSGSLTGGSATSTDNIAYTFDGSTFTAQTTGSIPLPADSGGGYASIYRIFGPYSSSISQIGGSGGGIFAWNGSTLGFWLLASGTGGGADGFVTMQRTGNDLSAGTAFALTVANDSIASDSLADSAGAFAISPDGSIIAFSASSSDAGTFNPLYPPRDGGGRSRRNRIHIYKNGTLTANVLPANAISDSLIYQMSISDDGKALVACSETASGSIPNPGNTTTYKINSDGSLTQLDQKGPGRVAFFSHQYRCPV